MRRSVINIVGIVLLAAALACGSSSSRGSGAGTCLSGRACAVACNADSDCSAAAGEVCTNQLCGQPVPTSTSYVQCSLDADCARGDYCTLGVCQHDCLADRDCSGGTVCSDRGRCIASSVVGQPPPITPPSAGEPSVDTAFLDFGSAATSLTFNLSNTGSQPFDFRLLSSRGWLSASPYQGQVKGGQSVAIQVALDRTAASYDSGVGGFIGVNTSAGYLRVGAGVSMDLTGAWTGTLHVTGPVDLGEQTLVVDVQQSGTGLFGWVDAERSLLYPLHAPVSGTVYTVTGEPDAVSFGFELQGPKGTDLNPAYPKDVVRHFTFTGTRSDGSTLTGTFTEAFDGILDVVQTKLSGEAVFTRGGPVDEGTVVDPAPAVSITVTGNPMVDGAGALKTPYQGCASCPGGACSASPADNVVAFLKAKDGSGAPKLAFYNAFWQAWHTPSTTSPFQSIDDCAISKPACAAPYDIQSLRCAQYWSWKGLTSDATSNGRDLMDALEPVTDYGLYLGDARTAAAMDAWYNPGSSLDQQIALLTSAEQDFVGALHSSDQTAPLALLDPFYANVVGALPAGAAAGPGASLLVGYPINEDASFRFTGEHVRRALRSLESGLFVASRRADLQRRQQKDGDAATSLRRAEVRTWIDLAALAPTLWKSPSTWTDDVTPLQNALRDASRRFADIEQGRNLFGYADAYVPFLWHYSGPSSGTNFTQIKALADSNQSIWSSIYADASSSLRTFETSTAALASELSNQQSTISLQLQGICGPGVTDMSQCGVNGTGQLASQVLEVKAAVLRIENIVTQMVNVYASMRFEEDRAAQVAQLHQSQAALILATGERVYVDDKAIRTIDAAERAAHSLFGGVVDFIESVGTDPIPLAEGAGDAAITGVAAMGREGYERDKAEAIAYEQAQVEYDAAQAELIDSAARVKTLFLQIPVLQIDFDIAVVNLEQATCQLRTLRSTASALLSDQARVAAIAKVNGGYAMHYRVYANHRMREEADAMDRALGWSFLATRAIGYQLVRDMPIASLLQVRDPLDLLNDLGTLNSVAGATPTSQSNSDVISLRDRILGLGDTVKDTTTGADVSPRERFHRFVADPAHRDAQGDLHIFFSTAGLEQQVFSTSVCSDRIQTVAVNLIGDSLGTGVTSAYVKLKHGGTSYLRSCTPAADGSTSLVAYDMTASGNGPATARVHAAINGTTDGVAQAPPDYELSDRAVLADTWELIIEAGDNRGLNVLGLDDIQLTFVHDSYTIQ